MMIALFHVVAAQTAPAQSIKMWETAQWSLENGSYSGNPFDLVATAVFTHEETDEEIRTDLFYDGDDTWRFRFLGSKEGKWSFLTESDDDDLAGYIGEVTVGPPNAGVLGLMGTKGHKFTVPTENGNEIGYLLNIYEYGYGREEPDRCLTRMDYFTKSNVKSRTNDYLDKCEANGMEVIQLFMTETHSTWHNDETGNPELETFELLDTIFTLAADRGIRVHFWQWGDGGRHTPDIDDRPRIRRYIASRLAPLNGWTMSYGYDLSKDPSKGGEWAAELHGYMGWHHLLWARHWQAPELDAVANDDRRPVASDPYGHTIDLFSEHSRPIVYERRWWQDRDGFNAGVVRRAMWEFALAGGAASWWGELSDETYSEEHLERFRTHYQFWHGNRRFLVAMQPDNDLTDGYCLNGNNTHFIFYKEDATSIRLDISGASGDLDAIAVDTKKEYEEMELTLEAVDQTWDAPYESDWAIAVGNFNSDDITRAGSRKKSVSEAVGRNHVHPEIVIQMPGTRPGGRNSLNRKAEYFSLTGRRVNMNTGAEGTTENGAVGLRIVGTRRP